MEINDRVLYMLKHFQRKNINPNKKKYIVEFLLDNDLIFTDFEEPYTFLLDKQIIGNSELKIIAYDKNHNTAIDQKNITIINFGIL